jgi:hypothetical protein
VIGLRNAYLAFYDVGDAFARQSVGPTAHAVGLGLRADVAWFSFVERTTLRLDVARTVSTNNGVQVWGGRESSILIDAESDGRAGRVKRPGSSEVLTRPKRNWGANSTQRRIGASTCDARTGALTRSACPSDDVSSGSHSHHPATTVSSPASLI